MGKSTISMAIFNSYFDITRGYFDQCRTVLLQLQGDPSVSTQVRMKKTACCPLMLGADVPVYDRLF